MEMSGLFAVNVFARDRCLESYFIVISLFK